MKITIDTKEDSKEDIKKAISMLQSLVDQTTNYEVSEVQPEQQTAMMGMFENQETETPSTEEKEPNDNIQMTPY